MKSRVKKKQTEQSPQMLMEKDMSVFYGLESTLLSPQPDARHLIRRSRNGVTMHFILQLLDKYHLSLKEMAAILNVSERTLQRYTDEDILSKDASERALHLQRLFQRGASVFGSLDKFTGWMNEPALIFSNERPLSFLDTIFGFEIIEQELGRIEHGIFA